MRISDWISDVCSSDLLFGEGQGGLQVVGPHRRGEAVLGVVGGGQHLLLVGPAEDAGDRADHLLAGSLAVVAALGEHHRPTKKARRVGKERVWRGRSGW